MAFLTLVVIFVTVGVAFPTLLERGVLCYIHIRKGPNKVGFVDVSNVLEMLLGYFLGSNIFLCFLTI